MRGGVNCFGGVVVREGGRGRRSVVQSLLRGALDQLADDHRGAAGDGGAGVGDDGGVGLRDEDVVVGEAQGLRGDLAEDGVGALAELGGGDEDAAGGHRAVMSMWTSELRRRSPEPVKPAPCMKVAKPMPRLIGRGGVLCGEARALGVVAGLVERAGEQVLHVDGFGEELAGGGAVAGGEEVAAAQFFGREADDAGDLVHVALEREEGLRRAEAAEGAVRRDVGGHGLGADA